SWIGQASLRGHAAWVPVGRGEGDPQRFWLSVLSALRQTGRSSVLVQPLTAAPDLDGWVIAKRLLKDLAPLDDPVWLVVDDVQELGPDALAQLELLIMRAPPAKAASPMATTANKRRHECLQMELNSPSPWITSVSTWTIFRLRSTSIGARSTSRS